MFPQILGSVLSGPLKENFWETSKYFGKQDVNKGTLTDPQILRSVFNRDTEKSTPNYGKFQNTLENNSHA